MLTWSQELEEGEMLVQGRRLLKVLFVLAVARISIADSLVTNFDFPVSYGTGIADRAASEGQAMLTLHRGEPITASLVARNASILGFGLAGFHCPGCGSLESWQTGAPGLS